MQSKRLKRILVVDDEPHVAMVTADALNNLYQPCELLIAESASQALQKAGGKKIDLVITDYRMPGTDGLALINSLRKESPDMAAILMTAYGTEQIKSQAARSGVDQFMAKPFALDDIRRVVREVLSKLDTSRTTHPTSEQARQQITGCLGRLVADVGARCACVIRQDGSLVDTAGGVAGLDMQVMATLMAANFAAMVEIARLLGNPRSFDAINHESRDDNVYTCTAGPDHLLVVIYGLTVKSGAARYYTKKSVEVLTPLLETTVVEADLADLDLGAALDGAFSDEQQMETLSEDTTAAAEWPRGETITLDEAIRRGIIGDLPLRKG
ncbi:MAG TPA: response regulator [Anaerolineales bacterium]|nr:response regulator [Anaerolineales bacterium]